MGMEQAALAIDITVAATADDERYVAWPFSGTWKLVRAMFAPATAVSIDASNYFTATLTKNDGAAGSDSSAIASFNTTTGGSALVLKTTLDLTITERGFIDAGDQLKFAKVETGTGAAMDGSLVIVCEKVN